MSSKNLDQSLNKIYSALRSMEKMVYRNDPKVSDRQIWFADPDQTAPRSSLIWVYTVCHSVCILWTQYSMVKPHCLNFRIIIAIFWGCLDIFTVIACGFFILM